MNIINKQFGKRGVPAPGCEGRAERYSRSDDRKYRDAVYWRARCEECGRKVCRCENQTNEQS